MAMASILPASTGIGDSDRVLKSMDANRYATKKTIAQGMLDIALLTANASQLKYILQVGDKHEFYGLMLTLISISIILQMLVGILFVVIGSLNINRKPDQTAAIVLNDIILVSAAMLAVILTLVNLHGGEVQRKVANILNHFSLGFVVVALFCDIVQGIACILLANYNINKETSRETANAVQNFSLGLNMATVVVNIMINGMEVKHMDDVGPGLAIESSTKGL
uniref:Ninjurin-2 n=1 Tax=Anopheles atroparvus TaxID=41427 RepID=A0A182JKU3_ANOAO